MMYIPAGQNPIVTVIKEFKIKFFASSSKVFVCFCLSDLTSHVFCFVQKKFEEK
jgi:hypothetical protein